MARHRPSLLLLLFLGLALVLPFLVEGYTLYRFTMAGAFAIAILGINLLTGVGGQFSIGHGAFFAIGAYTVAIAGSGQGLPLPVALALAPLVSFGAGFLFGWPALRLGTVQLALATWGLAVAVPQLLKHRWLEAWTGGVQGLYLERPPPPEVLGLAEDTYWYAITLALMLGAFWLVGNLIRGPVGRTLRAARDHEIAAASLGIDIARYRSAAFGVSAGLCGLGGAIAALLSDFIAADGYTVFFSILLLVGAMAGGIGSVWGALAGGLLVEFLPDLAGDASAALSFPMFGVILILLVWLLPEGLVPAAERLARRLERRDRRAG